MPSSLCVAGMGVTCVSLQCYRCKQNCSYFFSEPGLIHVGAINYCSKTIILLVLPITGGHFNPNCKPTINSMYALSRDDILEHFQFAVPVFHAYGHSA